MNKFIKILDLILPFKKWYEELKEEYENQIGACITYEAWDEYLEQSFGKDLFHWICALALSALKENAIIKAIIKEDEDFDFVQDSEIIYGIDSSPLNISRTGITRSLSPACIPSFWTDKNNNSKGDTIIKLIAAFNDTSTERRIFNEVHYYESDPNITLGFGHFAAENIECFFKEMPVGVWKTMCKCMMNCINSNKIILTDQKNTNIHKTYKEQFWQDYNAMFNERISPNNDVTEDHLSKYFRSQNYDSNRIRKRCKAVFNSYRDIIHKLLDGKALSDSEKEGFIWGDENGWNHAKIINRIATKDAYVTKAQRFHEALVCIYEAANKTLSGLEAPVNLFDDKKIINDGLSLYDFRQQLLNTTKESAKKIDYNELYKKLKGLLTVFNTLYSKYKKDFGDKYKEIVPNTQDTFSKSDTVSTYSSLKDMNGSLKEDENGNKKYILPMTQPFRGNVEYNGYWFYDIMKVALRLRKVCFYQVLYWINHVLEYKDDLSNAAVAARSSWGSSRFKGLLNNKEKTESYLSYKNNNNITIKNPSHPSSKALMYWQNYNAIRANDEKKESIRGRQKQIWEVWFKDYYSFQPDLKLAKGIPSFSKTLEGNSIKDERTVLIEYIKKTEPDLMNYDI